MPTFICVAMRISYRNANDTACRSNTVRGEGIDQGRECKNLVFGNCTGQTEKRDEMLVDGATRSGDHPGERTADGIG